MKMPERHRGAAADLSRIRNRLRNCGILNSSAFAQEAVMSFSRFHPLVQRWFTHDARRADARAARAAGRRSRDGRHTLIAAPTGSGKTLAAFLTAIDDLVQRRARRRRCPTKSASSTSRRSRR